MAILPRVRAGSSIARPPGLFVLACAALPAACGQPDASPPDAAAPDAGVDAPPLDAAADGMPPGARILITWTMLREWELLPCSEFHASAASHYMSVVRFEVPCDEHHVITDWLPLDTYDVDVMLFEPSSGATRLFFARPGVVLDEPGATVYVPLLFEVFDEPEDQLQAIFATARAYYLASPLPHALPPAAFDPTASVRPTWRRGPIRPGRPSASRSPSGPDFTTSSSPPEPGPPRPSPSGPLRTTTATACTGATGSPEPSTRPARSSATTW